jgi:antitoxin (DNA-binding transcriptional repressor) of toxin-antitoxin stability system
MRRDTTVGVREFRARLSAHLRAVAGGATITVGDRRRRPLARLIPAAPPADLEALERLASRGAIHRGTGKPGAAPRGRPRRHGPSVSDLVIEDRR